MLLVEAEYCREELRELFFQLLTGKQVAHGTQSCHHCKPELKRQQRPPCLLMALNPRSNRQAWWLLVYLWGNYGKRSDGGQVGHSLWKRVDAIGTAMTNPHDKALEQVESSWM